MKTELKEKSITQTKWDWRRFGSIFVCVIFLYVTAVYKLNQNLLSTLSYYETSGQEETVSYVPPEAEVYCKNDMVAAQPQLALTSKAAALIDAKSGRLLYGKDEMTPYPMASTTKIMTCMYALENSNLDSIVTISKNAASQPKTRLGIMEGEQYTLRDLLYALMLESCNDCAVAIAEHVSGSSEQFCSELTQKAKSMGWNQTNFKTPNGLDAPGHATTAYELAEIGSYAIRNQTFLEITNCPSYTVMERTKSKTHTLHNKNRFLTLYPGAIGIKTGYTSQASYCFVGAVQNQEQTFVSAILSAGSYPHKTVKWNDTKTLMDYGVSMFHKIPLFHSSECVYQLAVEGGVKKYVPIYVQGAYNTLLKADDKVEYKIKTNSKKISAPVKEGQIVGEIYILINEKQVASFPLKTGKSCDAWNYKRCFCKTLLKYLNTAF